MNDAPRQFALFTRPALPGNRQSVRSNGPSFVDASAIRRPAVENLQPAEGLARAHPHCGSPARLLGCLQKEMSLVIQLNSHFPDQIDRSPINSSSTLGSNGMPTICLGRLDGPSIAHTCADLNQRDKESQSGLDYLAPQRYQSECATSPL